MTPSDPTNDPIEQGTSVGRFLVQDFLGAGSAGRVYVAFDPELNRRVALRIFHPSVPLNATTEQALVELRHPNVLPVYFFGIDGAEGSRRFVAMEYQPGDTLRGWLDEKARTPAEIRGVFLGVAKGLAAAHQAGIVHGDFRASNVLLDERLSPQVSDFGLGQLRGSATLDGHLAPEQLSGEPPSASGDQFSFCVALYEALHGRRPFEAQTVSELRTAMTLEEPRWPPTVPPLPLGVRAVLARGIAAAPEKRFESMDALANELAREPMSGAKRFAMALTLMLLLFMVGAGAYVWHQRAACRSLPAQVTAHWEGAPAQEVAARFEASKLPNASTLLASLGQALSGYAQGLGQARQTACLETRRTPGWAAQRARVHAACAQEREANFAALIGLLREADRAELEESVRAAQSLPSPLECDASAPLPRAAWGNARAELRQAQLYLELGNLAQASAHAQGAREQAQRVEDAVSHAGALLTLARAQRGLGHRKDSVDTAHEAVAEATRAGASDVALEAWLNIATLEALVLSRLDEARWGLKNAEGELPRSLHPRLALAELDESRAVVLHAEGKFDEAAHAAKDAAAAYRSLEGEHSLRRARALLTAASPLLALRKFDEAEAVTQDAAEIRTAVLGARSVSLGAVASMLAAIHGNAGKLDQAHAELERCVDIYSRAGQGDSPELSVCLQNLATYDMDVGRYADALPSLRKALELQKHQGAEALPRTSELQAQLGLAQLRLGHLPEAQRDLEAALQGLEKSAPAGDARTLRARANLGCVQQQRGELARAQQTLEPLVAPSAHGLTEESLADAKLCLAHALWPQKPERPHALTLARAAQAVYVKSPHRATDARTTAAWLKQVEPLVKRGR